MTVYFFENGNIVIIFEFSLLGSGSTGAGGGGNRKLRIQKRKEEEAGSSDAAKVLSAMRKVAEDSKSADVEKTNKLAEDFEEHVSK